VLAAITTSAWAYPALEVLHLLGVSLLLGNLFLLEARVWGAASALDLRALARLALALSVAGFALAAASGLVMFATQAAELLANRVFTAKMALIMLAGCNAGWFHARRSLERADGTARALMGLSTVLWLATLTAGRWIAYV
jgi:hypothetical protein